MDEYDTVLIDCPPSLGVLTINGLTAAAEVIVPLQCETLGHRGVGQLLETIGDALSKALLADKTMADGFGNALSQALRQRQPLPVELRFGEGCDVVGCVVALGSLR